jgi:hypothetical protein
MGTFRCAHTHTHTHTLTHLQTSTHTHKHTLVKHTDTQVYTHPHPLIKQTLIHTHVPPSHLPCLAENSIIPTHEIQSQHPNAGPRTKTHPISTHTNAPTCHLIYINTSISPVIHSEHKYTLAHLFSFIEHLSCWRLATRLLSGAPGSRGLSVGWRELDSLPGESRIKPGLGGRK